MASERGGRELAAQGSECPLGESASTRNASEMRRRIQSPLGTGEMTMSPPSESEIASTPSPSPETSKDCRRVYKEDENCTGGTLGPTRAMIDVRKQKFRRNKAVKLQFLNNAKQEMETLQSGVEQLFTELESNLLAHPAHPSVHVQNCSAEFNIKSMQVQQLQKQISVMKNELHLIDMMLKRRSEPVLSKSQRKTCTTSRQFSKRESEPTPEVFGFPICENQYDRLSNFESNTEGRVSETPIKVEDENEEEMQLIDPRQNRTQKLQSENSKSVNPKAEPVMSIQETVKSVQSVQMQYMTEQAEGLQLSVQDQDKNQFTDQSMQKLYSTKKSTNQSSELSAQSGAYSSAHSGAYQSVNTAADQSAHTGAVLQQIIPLPIPTVELKPRSPPTFHGKFREDVSRWIQYMGNYLTFMQGTPDQQVKFAVTYIRGPALEWWDKYVKESGYPASWTVMSNALKRRYGLPFRAKEAQARIMHIQQGKRKIRDYSNEFLTLLNRLISYDESWMVNIYIWGLQPHFAKYVSAYCPETVSQAIKIAEETEFSIWASQKDRLTKKPTGRQPKVWKKSTEAKRNQQQQYQHQQQ